MQTTDNYSSQAAFLMQALSTPWGWVMLGTVLLLAFLALVTQRGRWVMLACAIYFAHFGYFLYNGKDPNTLIPVLHFLRDGSQVVTGLLLLLLLLPALSSERPAGRGLGKMVWAFFALDLIYCLRMLLAGLGDRAFFSAGVFTLLLLSLGWGVSRWLHTMEDAYRLMGAFVVAGILFVIGTSAQLALDPNAILINGRLLATTGNPQHVAVVLNIVLIPTCFLMIDTHVGKPVRLLCGALTAILLLLLVWTGSRTGALMALVGLGLLFRFRIGKLLGAGVVLWIFILLGMSFYGGGAGNFERLTSTLNTRGGNWTVVFNDFLGHPLFGYMEGAPGITENSYLAVAGRMGVMGLIPLFLALFWGAKAAWRVTAARRRFGSHALLADAAIASLASLAVGAIFEGFLLATIAAPALAIYLFLTLLSFLQRQAEQALPLAGWDAAADDGTAAEWYAPVAAGAFDTPAEIAYEQGYAAGYPDTPTPAPLPRRPP